MYINGVKVQAMSKPEVKHLNYKVVLLGDQYCGKSSIIHRYVTGKYSSTYLQTIGSEYVKRLVEAENNPVLLYIYDTMGQGDMKTITRSLYRNAQGIILVFDFSRRSTLDHIKDWIDLIEMNCEPTRPEIILVGNKVDLVGSGITVSREEAMAVANHYDLSMIEVSAKTDVNVSLAFSRIANNIFKNRKRLFSPTVETSIKLHQPPERDKKGCCDS